MALRNEDFRKMLTERRTTSAVAALQTPGGQKLFSHRHQAPGAGGAGNKVPVAPGAGAAAKKNNKKKYFRPKKPAKKGEKDEEKAEGEEEEDEEEDDDEEGMGKLNDILKNYRDRAEERRRGVGSVEEQREAERRKLLAGGFQAVPGDRRTARTMLELRKQAIEDSKYLGGDMEHTHLVKGLDYSLLNKVRAEMEAKDGEADEELESALKGGHAEAKRGGAAATQVADDPRMSDNLLVRNLTRIVFPMGTETSKQNQLYAKGRMAYVVDMENEEADIPTTLMRSVAEVGVAKTVNETKAGIAPMHIVIGKLASVLSYLRPGGDGSKSGTSKKKDGDEETAQKAPVKPADAGQSIFEGEDEYKPDASALKKERERHDKDRGGRHDHRRRDEEPAKKHRYFGDDEDSRRDKERDETRRKVAEERAKVEQERREKEQAERLQKKLEERRRQETEGYDECYPGAMVSFEGDWEESDDEGDGGMPKKGADYTAMDKAGGKKGLSRFDFATDEEYANYQASREAIPKVAYQYGVKKADGRQNKKTDKAEKAKFNRQLQQIEQLMEKRKKEDRSGEGDGSESKRARH